MELGQDRVSCSATVVVPKLGAAASRGAPVVYQRCREFL
jgi:hypothetical protein